MYIVIWYIVVVICCFVLDGDVVDVGIFGLVGNCDILVLCVLFYDWVVGVWFGMIVDNVVGDGICCC